MHMVRQNLQGVDLNIQLLGLLLQQHLQPPTYRTDQDRTAVLGTPNQMIFEAEYGTRVLSVLAHIRNYTESVQIGQTKREECRNEERRIPLSPEGDSPLRAELMATTIARIAR